MKRITETEWNAIPKDYKDVWTSDDVRGTNYNGRRTWMVAGDNGSTLLIEGVSFEIIEDLYCEFCGTEMTEEEHNICDICGNCLEADNDNN
jgi:hypothetical protein